MPAGGMELLSFLLQHAEARFYRVEVTENLFGEYSVCREWGPRGRAGARSGRQMLVWFSNLRDAVIAADNWRRHATQRGYRPERMAK